MRDGDGWRTRRRWLRPPLEKRDFFSRVQSNCEMSNSKHDFPTAQLESLCHFVSFTMRRCVPSLMILSKFVRASRPRCSRFMAHSKRARMCRVVCACVHERSQREPTEAIKCARNMALTTQLYAMPFDAVIWLVALRHVTAFNRRNHTQSNRAFSVQRCSALMRTS